MSEIKLFDTWTFQEEVPEPFHQLLKKEGLRKTTMIIPGLFEPPVRTLRATIPENESHIFR